MTTSTERVRSYLDDLARMLADLDPGDRDEILAGVREHVDAAINASADGERATGEVLDRLGPPHEVAAEARSALGSSPPAGRPLSARTPHLAWVVSALVLTLLTTVPFLVAALTSLLGSVGGPGVPPNLPFVSSPVLMVLLAWPLWLAGVVGLVVGRRRIPRTWKLLLADGPITVVVVGVTGPALEPTVLSPFFGVPLIVAVLLLVLATVRAAWRETAAPRP